MDCFSRLASVFQVELFHSADAKMRKDCSSLIYWQVTTHDINLDMLDRS